MEFENYNEDKQTYYKVYNGVNQLMLSTPVLSNAKEFLQDCTGLDLSEVSFSIALNGSRFIEGFRVEKVKI